MSHPMSDHSNAEDSQNIEALQQRIRDQDDRIKDQGSRLEAQEMSLRAMFNHHQHVSREMAEFGGQLTQLKTDIPKMMAEGIVSAVGNPKTWSAAKAATKVEAQQAAGGAVLGAMKFVIDKLIWTAVGLFAIYSLGGMPALLAMFKIKAAS